jgi:hypothetical protein
VARAEQEQALTVQRALLAEPGCQRWLRWDAWAVADALAALPAAERDQLVAEVLDCFWHHRYSYSEAAFQSRGLRGAALFLTRQQVEVLLARCGLTLPSAPGDG